jgi:hypothetical protein
MAVENLLTIAVFGWGLLAEQRSRRRRVERAFASARGKAKRRGKRADQGETVDWAVANTAHETLLRLRHSSKPREQGEVRISLFRAF